MTVQRYKNNRTKIGWHGTFPSIKIIYFLAGDGEKDNHQLANIINTDYNIIKPSLHEINTRLQEGK